MNKKVVWLTSCFLVIAVGFLGFQIFRYYQVKGESREKKVQAFTKKIEDVMKEIEEKEKEKQSLEEEKAWKIEVYKTWEKEVNS